MRTIVCFILLILALVQDLKSRKIKNKYNLISLLVAMLFSIIVTDNSIAFVFLGIACAAVIGIVLWKMGAIGAGDAKFLWTLGALYGWRQFLWIIAFSIIGGGVLGFIYIFFVKKDGRQRAKRLWEHFKSMFLLKKYITYEAENRTEFPFMIAILTGYICDHIWTYIR